MHKLIIIHKLIPPLSSRVLEGHKIYSWIVFLYRNYPCLSLLWMSFWFGLILISGNFNLALFLHIKTLAFETSWSPSLNLCSPSIEGGIMLSDGFFADYISIKIGLTIFMTLRVQLCK